MQSRRWRSRRARGRHASPRRCWPPACDALPHHAGERRAARALLHDGRVLRLPRHHRRRRQPPGLPGAGARGHADRDPAGQAGDRNDDATGSPSAKPTTSSSIGAGPAGLAAAATAAEAGLSTLLLDENAGARRPDLSRHHHRRRSTDRDHARRGLLGRRAISSPRRCARAAPRSSSGATVWSLDPQPRDRRLDRRRRRASSRRSA